MKTHCVRGHLLEGDNVRSYVLGSGPRRGKAAYECLGCGREFRAAWGRDSERVPIATLKCLLALGYAPSTLTKWSEAPARVALAQRGLR